MSGKNLQLINANENYAFLFDSEKGKLYKQLITHESTLSTAFDNNYLLLNNQTIPATKELFLTEQFKTVWKEGGIIQLVTKEGVILSMDDSEKATWIGLASATIRS